MPLEGEYEPLTWSLASEQVELYEASGGLEGTVLNGAPCVILWTRGKSTGKVRKAPVIRVTDGERYAVVGSMGGAPKDPGWCNNLRAAPTEVSLQDGPELRDYVAHEASGNERAEWWARANEAWPPYDEYQTRTDRVIPVFVLEPRG
jgi:deazaflavin-dependent oxidoreductase (nitroreductase family)